MSSIVNSVLKGRHITYVSNKHDSDLCEQLTFRYQPSEVDYIVAQPRKIQALCERIRNKSTDVVLIANGFLYHKEVDPIVAACKSAGVPFVPVRKGRMGEIAQGLDQYSRHLAPLLLKNTPKPPPKTEPKQSAQMTPAQQELDRISKELTSPSTTTKIVGPAPETWVLRKDLAELAGMSVSTLRRHEAAGDVKGHHDPAGCVRFNPVDAENFIRKHHMLRKKRDVAREELEARIAQTTEEPEAETTKEKTPVVVQGANKDGPLLVELQGPTGTSVIETKRTMAEIVTWLMGLG